MGSVRLCGRPQLARCILGVVLVFIVTNAAEEEPGDGLQTHSRALQSVPSRFQKPYRICFFDRRPMSHCNPGAPQDEYVGYQVTLWRRIADVLKLKPEDYFYECWSKDLLLDELVNLNGTCTVAPGIDIRAEYIVAGMKFSWPTYKSGLQVLVFTHEDSAGDETWSFALSFHWSIWVAAGGTACAVTLAISIIEVLTNGERANRKGMRGWGWYVVTKWFQIPTHVGDPKTWASRILVLGYAFVVLIIVHLFTAATANRLTMQRLERNIHDVSDLPGKKVATADMYVARLRRYYIGADGFPWNDDKDTAKMIAALRSQEYDALVLDIPVVHYSTAVAPMCDIYPIGLPFESVDLAFGFPADVPTQFVSSISAAIIGLQTEDALLDNLEHEFIEDGGMAEGSICADDDPSAATQAGSQMSSIHLHDVAGLWYLLAIMGGFSMLLTFVHNYRLSRHFRHRLNCIFTLRWGEAIHPIEKGSNSEGLSEHGQTPVTAVGKDVPQGRLDDNDPDAALFTGSYCVVKKPNANGIGAASMKLAGAGTMSMKARAPGARGYMDSAEGAAGANPKNGEKQVQEKEGIERGGDREAVTNRKCNIANNKDGEALRQIALLPGTPEAGAAAPTHMLNMAGADSSPRQQGRNSSAAAGAGGVRGDLTARQVVIHDLE